MTAPGEVQEAQKYRLIAELGRGGMADVYLAVVQGHLGFNKLVVVKQTRRELTDDADIMTMFLDEARLAARLNHPNVVQTYEIGHEQGRTFIAMEYLDGQPLHRVRGRVAPSVFPVAMQLRILCEALAGLHYAHELTDFDGSPLAIVHRDATPHNVFVTYDGVVKLVDFGVAKAAGASAQTQVGVIKGKVPYMAPEQARAEPLDRRADVFAAGVMLWESIAGRRMWKGVDDAAAIARLARGDLPLLRDVAPNVDPLLEYICARATAAAREARYPTAADLQNEIERWLERRGYNVSAREVGAFVAAHFAEERAMIKGVIEAQIGNVRWSGTFPRVSRPSLPMLEAHATSRSSRGSPGAPPSERRAPRSSATGTTQAAIQSPAPTQSAPDHRLFSAAAGALVIASAVAFAGVRALAPSRAREPAPASPAPPASAFPAPPPVMPSAPAPSSGAPEAPSPTIMLSARVMPPFARLYLDGAPLSVGAYHGSAPRDGRAHRVRAEAPGFLPEEEQITTSNDVVVSLALTRAAPGKATPVAIRSTKAPDEAPPAPPFPPPTALEKRERPIDVESPYRP
jgi:eukaryotic-like serine/threonine-protein kinase